MNFYEQEMRQMFQGKPLLQDAKFTGKTMLAKLDDDLRIKLQFIATHISGQYDAVQAAVINRTDGVVDKQTFQFSDIIGMVQRSNLSPIAPHMWEYNGKASWYTPVNDLGKAAITETVLNYLAMYRTAELTEPAQDQTPLYLYPASYARDNWELEEYRASRKACLACKEAIEAALTEHYYNNRLNPGAVPTVLEKFRPEQVQHGLSIVEDPKPSRGHYGTWLGEAKQPSHQEQLRRAIDAALAEGPKDFEEFLKKLEAQGFEVNRERKHLRCKLPDWGSYTRCDTLKGDHTEEAILERIAGKRTITPRKQSISVKPRKVGLLVDIQAAIQSGKGPGYERWAKIFNLKQLSQAVIYLKENGDMDYKELRQRVDTATADFNRLSSELKELEAKMKTNGELQKQIASYAKTRAVYVDYRKAGYSKKFRSEHEADILIHQAAKRYFDDLGISKLPSVKSLREEYAQLMEQKRKAYAAYKQAKSDMQELQNIRVNVEYLLELHSEREQEKSAHRR